MKLANQQEAMFVAVEMEKSAVEMYERALWLLGSKEQRDERLYQTIQSVLSDEKRHLCQFSSLAMPLGGERENELLLKAQAADVLFPGGLMAAARQGLIKDERSMLAFAADSERKAAQQYRAFAKDCEGEDTRGALLSIAAEGDEHLTSLTIRQEAAR